MIRAYFLSQVWDSYKSELYRWSIQILTQANISWKIFLGASKFTSCELFYISAISSPNWWFENEVSVVFIVIFDRNEVSRLMEGGRHETVSVGRLDKKYIFLNLKIQYLRNSWEFQGK